MATGPPDAGACHRTGHRTGRSTREHFSHKSLVVHRPDSQRLQSGDRTTKRSSRFRSWVEHRSWSEVPRVGQAQPLRARPAPDPAQPLRARPAPPACTSADDPIGGRGPGRLGYSREALIGVILCGMEPNPVSEELPALYRAILDRVAQLDSSGERSTANRVRAEATRIYSRRWDEQARRKLEDLLRRHAGDAIRQDATTRGAHQRTSSAA